MVQLLALARDHEPAGHVTHAPAVEAPATLENVPAEQAVHVASEVPDVSEYVPAVQFVHAKGPLPPLATVADQEPPGQARQVDVEVAPKVVE